MGVSFGVWQVKDPGFSVQGLLPLLRVLGRHFELQTFRILRLSKFEYWKRSKKVEYPK